MQYSTPIAYYISWRVLVCRNCCSMLLSLQQGCATMQNCRAKYT